MCKKISRVSVFDETTNTYTASAYLIAQLGKNFALPSEQRIDGNALLDFALNNILRAKYYWGGAVEFLECEEKEPLLIFYTNNGFKVFNSRITKDNVKLYQLLKFILAINKIYEYFHISTPKQNIERQVINILKEFPEAITEETFTGSIFQSCKELEKLIRYIQAGDTIVFDSVSRMS